MRDTAEFVREFIALGFRAVVTCVNSEALDGPFAGRLIDEEFLASLPVGVDPCGERGEFHSFVFAGPSFKDEVRFTVGERVFRDSFWFCDLVPEG
jgi:diphthamide synthase (EF-2-diphthine--ammonia ligase)